MSKREATEVDRADVLEAVVLDERSARIAAQIEAIVARAAPGVLAERDACQRAQAAWRARVIEEYGVADLSAIGPTPDGGMRIERAHTPGLKAV